MKAVTFDELGLCGYVSALVELTTKIHQSISELSRIMDKCKPDHQDV